MNIHHSTVVFPVVSMVLCIPQQPLEMTAVKILNHLGMGISAATVALALVAGAAQAQQPAQVAPAARAALAPAAATTEPKKTARRAASKCRGLVEMACAGIPECTWVPARTTKAGKEVKGYCRTKPRSTGRPAAPK
jgi:hypothetical protein